MLVTNGGRHGLGAAIRALREAAGLTRQQLVDRMAEPVSVEMLAKVEQGRKTPSARTLERVARALEIDPVDLTARAEAWEAGEAAGMPPLALRQATTIGVASGVIAGGLGAAAFPLVGAAAVGFSLREMRERGRWAALLEAKLSDLVAHGTPEQLERVLASLESLDGEVSTGSDEPR